MQYRTWSVCLAVVAAGMVAGCSAHEKSAAKATTQEMAAPQPTPTPMAGVIQQNTVSLRATVTAIDQKTRKVTLRGPDGKTVTFKAGDQVRNLAQVKKGDTVVATYYESLAYEVKKPGEAAPGVSAAAEVGRAEPGEMPAGVGAQVITVTTTIEGIDKQAGTAVLKGPDGKEVTVRPRDPSKLDHVKVGDLVQFTYTEAIGIAVEPVAKGKSKSKSSGGTK